MSIDRPWPCFRFATVFLAIVVSTMLPGTAEELIDSDETEHFGEDWGQGFVAKDISRWITDFEYVEVVLYNSMSQDGTPLVASGELHKSVAKEWTKRLTPEEVALLTTFITGKRKPSNGGAGCYIPHHGFVFYGKDSKILGYIEICFMCENYKWSPQGGLSTIWDLDGLSALVAKKGLPTFKKPNEWQKFFADKEKVAKGPIAEPVAEDKIAE